MSGGNVNGVIEIGGCGIARNAGKLWHSIMRLLITNDDGWEAQGLTALADAMSELCDVVVVAPAQPQSECSHRVSTRDRIQVDEVREGVFRVAGSPADCVRIALRSQVADRIGAIDWVLSGINHGGNLGVDRYISGTVAAAREAAILGKPSVAFSHYLRRGIPIHWQTVAQWARTVFTGILDHPVEPMTYWNVNFPHLENQSDCPLIRDCPPDNLPLDVCFENVGPGQFCYSGSYPERPRSPWSDTHHCFDGHITRTCLTL